jgi:aspartate kinase
LGTNNKTSLKSKRKINITQGFLGSDYNNFTTTLGREGSDYTAAILLIV